MKSKNYKKNNNKGYVPIGLYVLGYVLIVLSAIVFVFFIINLDTTSIGSEGPVMAEGSIIDQPSIIVEGSIIDQPSIIVEPVFVSQKDLTFDVKAKWWLKPPLRTPSKIRGFYYNPGIDGAPVLAQSDQFIKELFISEWGYNAMSDLVGEYGKGSIYQDLALTVQSQMHHAIPEYPLQQKSDLVMKMSSYRLRHDYGYMMEIYSWDIMLQNLPLSLIRQMVIDQQHIELAQFVQVRTIQEVLAQWNQNAIKEVYGRDPRVASNKLLLLKALSDFIIERVDEVLAAADGNELLAREHLSVLTRVHLKNSPFLLYKRAVYAHESQITNYLASATDEQVTEALGSNINHLTIGGEVTRFIPQHSLPVLRELLTTDVLEPIIFDEAISTISKEEWRC